MSEGTASRRDRIAAYAKSISATCKAQQPAYGRKAKRYGLAHKLCVSVATLGTLAVPVLAGPAAALGIAVDVATLVPWIGSLAALAGGLALSGKFEGNQKAAREAFLVVDQTAREVGGIVALLASQPDRKLPEIEQRLRALEMALPPPAEMLDPGNVPPALPAPPAQPLLTSSQTQP
ncbi:hypothetical protein [Falsiroseomonas sp. HW251]|uniref:hypothetical protein n=1 Tax=Falsiroseomonas sp. HW251 TaxID=3390998 RepID=UPI003D3230E2